MKRGWPSAALCSSLALSLAALGSGCTYFKRFAYEGFWRDRWQHPEEVVRALGIRPGQSVADLGSGSGYFTFRLAAAAGPSGRVYAVDVDRGLNEYVERRAREKGYGNVQVVLADYDDPRIPGDGVDLIFTCNTYHHLEDRSAYFTNARKYLRPDGRVAIVEYNGEGWFQKLFGHATAGAVIRGEMEAAGFRLEREFGFLPRQHFLVFAAREG